MNNCLRYTLDDIQKMVDFVVSLTSVHKLFLLEGDMGAGKTTLVRTIFQKLGVQDPVMSPTFSYIQKYKSLSGQRLIHADLYRISSLQQLEELGLLEVLQDPQALVFIEWPAVLGELFNKKGVQLFLNADESNIDYRMLCVKMP